MSGAPDSIRLIAFRMNAESSTISTRIFFISIMFT
jgi:hypothetical protein